MGLAECSLTMVTWKSERREETRDLQDAPTTVGTGEVCSRFGQCPHNVTHINAPVGLRTRADDMQR